MKKFITLSIFTVLGLTSAVFAQKAPIPEFRGYPKFARPVQLPHPEPQLQNPVSLSKMAKTTYMTGRLIANSQYWPYSSIMKQVDSSTFHYSGTRGGDLTSSYLAYDSSKYYTIIGKNAQYYCQYDSKDSLTNALIKQWSPKIGAFRNYAQYVYHYNSSSLIDTAILYTWDTVANVWTNYIKAIYEYDSRGNVIRQTQQWNGTGGTWVNGEKYELTYDASSKVTQMLYSNWTGSAWKNQTRELSTYDSKGLLTTLKKEVWELTTPSTWENHEQSDYTYDSKGNMLTANDKSWLVPGTSASRWEPTKRRTFVYAGVGGKMSSELAESYKLSRWQNDTLYNYSWDTKGNLSERKRSYMVGTAWENHEWDIYTYDAANNLIKKLDQIWNYALLFWVNEFKTEYTWNSYNQLTKDDKQHWSTLSTTGVWEYKEGWGTYTKHYYYEAYDAPTRKPVVAYDASAYTGYPTTIFNFTDKSAFSPTNWEWSFNPSTVTFVGGTSSATQNPSVTFTNPGTYDVTLKSWNTAGRDSLTKIGYIVIVKDLSGINEQSFYKQANFYPNPGTSMFSLSLDSKVGITAVTVTDMSGKTHNVRWIQQGGTLNIHASNLSSGSYYISVETGTDKYMGLVVKQ